MKRFKTYKALSIIFAIFTIIGFFAINATINDDIIISVKPVIVEKCHEFGIYTMAEAQSVAILLTGACLFFSCICSWAAFKYAGWIAASAHKRTDDMVQANTDKEIKEMKKRREAERKEAERAEKEARKVEEKAKKEAEKEKITEEEAQTEETNESATVDEVEQTVQVVLNVKPSSTKSTDAKIEDILNALK